MTPNAGDLVAPPPPTRNPVCGMEVDPERPAGGVLRRGRYAYHFCSTRCRERFEADPLQFIAIDPVCGMEVNPHAARGGELEHAGRRYHFCNPRCRARFAANPGSFLAQGPGAGPKAAPPVAPPGGEVVWVCPMHPEVRERSRGPCPICGMALEPRASAACRPPRRPNPELAT